jgi:DNA-binding beta-propeller fold protein YncE
MQCHPKRRISAAIFCLLAFCRDWRRHGRVSPQVVWVTSGTAAASGFSPQMGVIDGTSQQLLFKIPVGTGAHSVAIDSTLGQVYVPFQPGAAGFPNGGISVFSTR